MADNDVTIRRAVRAAQRVLASAIVATILSAGPCLAAPLTAQQKGMRHRSF